MSLPAAAVGGPASATGRPATLAVVPAPWAAAPSAGVAAAVGSSALAVAPPGIVSNPVLRVLTGALSLFGLNSPTAPANPLGALVWGWFRRFETPFGVVPVAGTPTVGTPAPITGVVKGSLGVTVPGVLPLTYTVTSHPAYGAVFVDRAGSYTYAPAANGATGVTQDTFTVAASTGLAATATVVTVPVNPPASAPTFTVDRTIRVGQGPFGVAFNPDGRKVYVVNSGDHTVSTIYTDTKEVVTTSAGGGVGQGAEEIAVSPGGDKFYVTVNPWAGRKLIAEFNTELSPYFTNRIPVGDVGVFGEVLSPDGSRLYVATSRPRDGRVDAIDALAVIDTATRTVIATIGGLGDGLRGLAISPDGSKVYATHIYQWGSVKVIDTATNTVDATIRFPRGAGFPNGSIAVSPDGSRAYVTAAGGTGGVRVIDTATNTDIGGIDIGFSGGWVAVSPDGKYVYVTPRSDSWRNYVWVIDAATNTVIRQIETSTRPPPGTGPSHIAVSPDGRSVYVTNYRDGTVTLISVG